ncbi:MAG TPA: MBL fold metallo-hydrolase, partial [Puia sp.]|nr:MBL fold metallo-hydrolase [Puia sp.]
MKIIPLSEGSFTVDKSKRFVRFNTSTDDLQQRSAGSLLVEVQPFVIVTSKDVLVLDTGLGFEENGILQLHQNLINAGIQPSSVTKVLMSHLHKDHAGGIAKINRTTNSYEISFPNAKYYVQKQELDFAFEKGFPSYVPEELELLKTSSSIILLEGNGILENYIR